MFIKKPLELWKRYYAHLEHTNGRCKQLKNMLHMHGDKKINMKTRIETWIINHISMGFC